MSDWIKIILLPTMRHVPRSRAIDRTFLGLHPKCAANSSGVINSGALIFSLRSSPPYRLRQTPPPYPWEMPSRHDLAANQPVFGQALHHLVVALASKVQIADQSLIDCVGRLAEIPIGMHVTDDLEAMHDV